MREQRFLRRAAACLVGIIGCLLLAQDVRADATFDAERFHIAPNRATGFLNVYSARTAGKRAYSTSLWLDTFTDPLVLSDATGKQLASVVKSRTDVHFLFAYGFTDWLEIGLDVPLVVSQSGDRLTGTKLPGNGAGVGLADIRVVPRAELVSQHDDGTGFGLGLFADVSLPTGSQKDYRSDGYRVEPGVALEYAWSRLRLAANGGYIVRGQSHLGKLEHDDAVAVGAAGELFIIEGLSVVPEFKYEKGIAAEKGSIAHQGRELVYSGRYLLKQRVLFEVGGGKGIKPSSTVADWRVFAGLSWVGRGKSSSSKDSDGDGVEDAHDRCKNQPEDRDNFEDQDGCPDADNDGDKIPDEVDGEHGSCKNQPEDVDDFADDDGCPEFDNDRDSIPDTADACVLEAEDLDQNADDDGCPEPDNDGDGIPDISDGSPDATGFGACRDTPEDKDGVEDDDGCPEANPSEQPPPAAPAVCSKAEFPDHVKFPAGKSFPSHEGRKAIRALARALKSSPEVKRVRLEGHADDQGDDLFNQSLSQRRAINVRDRLQKLGVTQEIETVGLGESRPFQDNQSDEGRAENRRVEIIVSEQAGCP